MKRTKIGPGVPVSFDAVGAIVQVPYSLREVHHEQTFHQVREIGREMTGHLVNAVDDVVEHLSLGVRVERRRPGHHFVQDDAESPPVHRFPVRFDGNDLGCQVVRGPAHGGCPFGDALAQPEVREFDKTVLVNQHVLGF